MKEIDKLRKEIDSIDKAIVRQLNNRMSTILKMKEFKELNNLAVEDIAREKEIIASLQLDKLDEEFVKEIYSVIFAYSKSRQRT